jgi:hypothetical protein
MGKRYEAKLKALAKHLWVLWAERDRAIKDLRAIEGMIACALSTPLEQQCIDAFNAGERTTLQDRIDELNTIITEKTNRVADR